MERAFLLKPGIGYLRVASFDEKTGRLIRDAIEKLGGRNLEGLVLDLRKNPGGLVTSALETAALFLKPGARIVTVRGRNVAEKSEAVPSGATPYQFPLVVLVDERTASASEIWVQAPYRTTTGPPWSAWPALAKVWSKACTLCHRARGWL